MAYDTYVGSFAITTAAATSTQSITGVGFEPKALIFWWSGNTSATDSVAAGHGRRGMGFAVSSTDRRSSTCFQGDAYATTEENIQIDDTNCIMNIGLNGSEQGKADLTSMDSDGFTLDIDVQFSQATRIQFLALGGADLTDVECFTFQMSASTGNQSISSLSFQPDCVLFLLGADATAPPTQDNGSTFAFGAAISSTERAAITGWSKNNTATSVTVGYALDIEAGASYSRNTGGTSLDARFDFVSMDTNGFTIDVLETFEPYVMGLALKGGDYAIASSQTQTNTSTDITVSGLGFQPASGLVFSHCAAESSQDTSAAHDIISIGGWTSTTERGATATRNQDSQSTSNVAIGIEYDAVYINIDPSTDSAVGLMDVKSVDSDGVTYIMDDADPSQSFFFTVFFGSEAAAATDVLNRGMSNIQDGVVASAGGGYSGLHPISEGFVS